MLSQLIPTQKFLHAVFYYFKFWIEYFRMKNSYGWMGGLGVGVGVGLVWLAILRQRRSHLLKISLIFIILGKSHLREWFKNVFNSIEQLGPFIHNASIIENYSRGLLS